SSGPMEARFRLSVQNAVRNVLRTRARRAARSPATTGDQAHDLLAAIPDSRPGADERVVDEFRDYLRQQAGTQAVTLLDRRLDGLSLRRIARQDDFADLGEWGVRQLMNRVRVAARAFVRSHGDEELLRALERLAAARDVREWLLAT
ncbi:MAG: hypothetical protein K2V38_06710, partial [Gemmataceae bacterium]|nr:hypothetical protein [Gemmataceae bacterium]